MALTAEGLNVRRGENLVLRNIAFEAQPGAFIVIVGPNGAGKTTLVKAIAGLVLSTGRLEWDSRPMAAMSIAERAKILAYLPQGHVAHWPVTARDVVTIGRAPFASSLARLSVEDERAIDAAMDAVGATQFAQRSIMELSGGERARVMLARALAVGAPLMLADEPVTSLDPAHQLGVMSILSGLARQSKLVIAVSHDLLLARRFADRVIVLNDGAMVANGPPEQTLTAQLMRDIFRVESRAFQDADISMNIPWAAI